MTLRRPLVLVALATALIQPVLITYAADCQAQWKVVASTRNWATYPLKKIFKYTRGAINSQESSRSNSHSRTHEPELGFERNIVWNITASFRYKFTNTETETKYEMSGTQITQKREISQEITVPPYTQVDVWQLVANYDDGNTVGFHAVQILYNSSQPEANMNCTVQLARKIDVGIKFRIRHKRTGKYVVTIKRKGWEAATLGYNSDVYFTLVRYYLDKKMYVRIKISDPIFPGYDTFYATTAGGIYFDVEWEDERQLWSMSIQYPADGDTVTFRNKYWPNSGLMHYKESTSATNVYCLYTHDLEQWILEVVDSE